MRIQRTTLDSGMYVGVQIRIERRNTQTDTGIFINIYVHVPKGKHTPCVKFESRQENTAETKVCNLVVTPTKVNVG